MSPPSIDTPYEIDITQNGTADYEVKVSPPTCVDVVDLAEDGQHTTGYKINHYDIRAEATDSRTGAKTVIHQGIRVKLLESDSCA
jgi:hypothetical protein